MTPGQVFAVFLVVTFSLAAFETVRTDMACVFYFGLMTFVVWLGVGVGYFIKICAGVLM